MAAYIVADAGADMALLTGSGNYQSWAQEFEIACRYRGIWDLFKSKGTVIYKPDEEAMARSIRNADSDDKAQRLVRVHAEERKRYDSYLQKKQYALAFFMEKIDPKHRGVEDWKNPPDAWNWAASKWDPMCQSQLQQELNKMEQLYQKDCTSVSQYVRKIEEIRENIVKAKGDFGDDDCKIKIVSGLRPEYVSRLFKDGHALSDIHYMEMQEFVDYLLRIEVEIEREV